MNNKFSPEIQEEINEIMSKIQKWDTILYSKIEFFYDGWAIFLREKNVYPRLITIFKSYENNTYLIKSYEISLKNLQREEFKEIYSIENLNNRTELLEELNRIIYGKDLIKRASNFYNKMHLKK